MWSHFLIECDPHASSRENIFYKIPPLISNSKTPYLTTTIITIMTTITTIANDNDQQHSNSEDKNLSIILK